MNISDVAAHSDKTKKAPAADESDLNDDNSRGSGVEEDGDETEADGSACASGVQVFYVTI